MADFKDLRKKQGLTQAELADKLDVAVNTVQNWERGRSLPSGENLNKYLKALGITNQVDITRLVGEISTAAYSEESKDELGNLPMFLFSADSQELLSIKQCYASAEELDMLGYVEYVRWDSKYSKRERRGDAKFPLEFAFFEKYGGFNATMKKISEARKRLGRLHSDALEFAEQNPGCEYRLISFDESEIIDKIAIYLDKKNYQNEIEDLYNCLKTIEAIGTDFLSAANMNIRLEKTNDINKILQSSIDYMTGERNLGKLTGYVELKIENSKDRPNISMLKLTERGKQLIQWGNKKHNIK
ncbi:helix-turn-helix domain-containing protein [Pseudobutyrivibrio sp.]